MEVRSDFAEATAELKRTEFLRALVRFSRGDLAQWIPVGTLGERLGIPYEETLRIVDVLRERTLVEMGDAAPLDPPHGPRVHILAAAIEHLKRLDQARQG